MSAYVQDQIVPKGSYRLVSLKSPRHHTWSLFTQCKYGSWGKTVTNGTPFPRSGDAPGQDVVDFGSWLGHFVPLGGVDDFHCYHPANYQSRHLASHVPGPDPHGVKEIPESPERFEPNLDVALNTYWGQDWVGLAEFYHESKCLLYHRLGSNAPDEVKAYVEKTCRCPKPDDDGDEHVSHHSEGKRSMLRDLPADHLSKIKTLTKVDTQVYKVALEQFMKEIGWMESDLALGRRVLCDPVLRGIESELQYLDVNQNSQVMGPTHIQPPRSPCQRWRA